MTEQDFQELVWQKGSELYRDMPWRQNTSPYAVLVSELMLQQTQVSRVTPKFEAFLHVFPTVHALASASLSDVLKLWSGLGYNRRAKYLLEAAKMIERDFSGEFPSTKTELMKLPGVGENTAGAIMAYSFNQPAVFIETNVRTVYFYHFFVGDESVADKQLRTLVEATIDREHPREFYWALMDYGAFLKSQGASQLDKSKHYKKQTPLRGSIREVRGKIIARLATEAMTEAELHRAVAGDERFAMALAGLLKDGLIERIDTHFHLAK